MILMAIKMLLRKYLAFQLEIKLDWSVIIGPILKLITELISGLVTAIVNVMTAPIDCAAAAVATVAELQRQLNQAVSAAQAAANQVGSLAQGQMPDGTRIESATSYASVEPGLKNPKKVRVGNAYGARSAPSQDQTKRVPTGFDLSATKLLPQAIKNKEFLSSHWSEQVLSAIADARDWITTLDDKLQIALANLNSLVGGGLAINLENIGLLLMIKDMIGMIVGIIQMLQSLGAGNKMDFCDVVQANPEVLRAHMERTAGRSAQGITFAQEVNGERAIAVYRGPDKIGTIATCINVREGTPQADMIKQWIADLNRSR
jgi:hypothetical protein